MWNTAKTALELLRPQPQFLQTLCDDGIERSGGVHVAFKDKVLFIGGWLYYLGAASKGMKNDVWEVHDLSALGDSKAELGHYRHYRLLKEHCDFPPRSDHACCVAADGTLYLTGGRLHPSRIDCLLNDMWASKDGVHWELVSDDCPWTARYSHTMLPCPNSPGDILLLAGQGGHIEGGWESFNDVWRYSKAQKEWKCVTQAAEWPKRASPTVRCGKDGDLILCGGEVIYPEVVQAPLSELDEPTLNDVWRSRDTGATWQCACGEGPFPKAREQWLEYLPRNQTYILFGKREGLQNCETKVYTSKDLSVWELFYSEVLDEKIAATAVQNELKCVLSQDDGTLVFVTQLLT